MHLHQKPTPMTNARAANDSNIPSTSEVTETVSSIDNYCRHDTSVNVKPYIYIY